MHRRFAALPLAAALLFCPAAAFADVLIPARDSMATISFTDPAFSDASLRIDSTQTIASGSSGTKDVRFGVSPTLQDYTLSSSGSVGVTLNSLTPPDAVYPFINFDLTVAASGAGSWTITERFGTDDPTGFGPLYRFTGRNDTYVPFENYTLPALEFYLPIGGLVDTDGSFGIGFAINGDWSTTGGLASTTGQYFLASLDPEWEIDTAFVYDPVADVTRFHATNPRYEGVDSDHPSPFLDVYFFGSAAATSGVPEPASWAFMIAGFGVIGAAMRRRTGLHSVARGQFASFRSLHRSAATNELRAFC